MSGAPSRSSAPALACVPEPEFVVPYVDVSETFWWPRRVYASRANAAGYRPEPVVLRTLVTNVSVDTTRGRLDPVGGPVVGLCADVARFLVSLDPPEVAGHGPDRARDAGVPVVRLAGWFRRGPRLQRVASRGAPPNPDLRWAASRSHAAGEGVRRGRHEDPVTPARIFLEQLHEAWGQRFAGIVVVGWPVYLHRASVAALLDGCTGQAILPEPGREVFPFAFTTDRGGTR